MVFYAEATHFSHHIISFFSPSFGGPSNREGTHVLAKLSENDNNELILAAGQILHPVHIRAYDQKFRLIVSIYNAHQSRHPYLPPHPPSSALSSHSSSFAVEDKYFLSITA